MQIACDHSGRGAARAPVGVQYPSQFTVESLLGKSSPLMGADGNFRPIEFTENVVGDLTVKVECALEAGVEPVEPLSGESNGGLLSEGAAGIGHCLDRRAAWSLVVAKELLPSVSISSERDTPFAMVPATNSAWWTLIYSGQRDFHGRLSMSDWVASSRPFWCLRAIARPKMRMSGPFTRREINMTAPS